MKNTHKNAMNDMMNSIWIGSKYHHWFER
jgi:hypothetical protein